MTLMPVENDLYTFGDFSWSKQWQDSYPCHVALVPEEDGQVSAIVLDLPGAASCGDTDAEALENVKESIRGLIELYREQGNPIPWKDYWEEDIPDGAKTKRIMVNV